MLAAVMMVMVAMPDCSPEWLHQFTFHQQYMNDPFPHIFPIVLDFKMFGKSVDKK